MILSFLTVNTKTVKNTLTDWLNQRQEKLSSFEKFFAQSGILILKNYYVKRIIAMRSNNRLVDGKEVNVDGEMLDEPVYDGLCNRSYR